MQTVRVTLPISKSIAIREMAMAALQYSQNIGAFLELFPESQVRDQPRDCRVMHRACCSWIQHTPSTQEVLHLDFVDAGTPFRFFTAIACVSDFPIVLSGNSSLQQRPILPLVSVLRDCGASITYLDKEGFAPIRVQGPLTNIPPTLVIDSRLSSQFASALSVLLHFQSPETLLHWDGPETSLTYYTLTKKLLARGLSHGFENDKNIATDSPNSNLTLSNSHHSSHDRDWSSAAFFYAKVSVTPGLRIVFPDLHFNGLQGDEALADLFVPLGVKPQLLAQTDSQLPEISIESIPMVDSRNTVLFFDLSNNLDLAPAIIVTLLLRGQSARIDGIENLQWKESNRLLALQELCRAVGASLYQMTENATDWYLDSSEVVWPVQLSLKTQHDHRLAMAYALLSTKIPTLHLDDTGCVEKSFPNYWEQLALCKFVK